MNLRKKSKYVHEHEYVAEVKVRLVEDKTGLSRYLSLPHAYKLNDVRDGFRKSELAAAKFGQIYELRPKRFNKAITWQFCKGKKP